MYHDNNSSLNLITAANNQELKISDLKTTFYDYTGVTKHAEIRSDGVFDTKGNLRSVPYNSPNSAHVATAADAGKVIYIAYDVHFNPSVFSSGDVVTIIPTTGITIKQNSGMTIYNTADGSTGDRDLAGRGMATIWFHDHNLAYISGVQLT